VKSAVRNVRLEIRVYFEGHKDLRIGFKTFFRELGPNVQFIAAKNGVSAFRKACRTHPNAWNILLKDSEGPLSQDSLKQQGLDSKQVKSVFWMVELMEAWLLADPEALAGYYGSKFSLKALRDTKDVEKIPKSDVIERLKRATSKTIKGQYNKVTHAPKLLEKLRPDLVKECAVNCRRLFEAIRKQTPGAG
jgi:hypothetical protein